ncbi:MAG: tetratricopeptide repeat-containing sensor histidine kinase [Cyclobacteriaceae bacterium]|nr:tetratricopeptide repeat-containing sensor histidine kinase [Cyclobacteriaceae bacterium]
MACKIKLLLLFSFLSIHLWGQNLDTLVNMLEPIPPGEVRVDMLNRIVTQMREKNIYDAAEYGEEAKDLAQKLDYQEGLSLALENLGWIYYRRGLYSDAFDLSQQALKISEELSDSVAMARCLNNVAAINYEKSQYLDAINKFYRAYQISSRQGDIETAVRSLNNISFSYLAIKKIDSAEYYAQKALESSSVNRQGYLPAFSYRILGDIEFEKGNLESALKYFNEGMRISEITKNYFIQASTLHRIGKVYARQKKYAMAMEALNRNIQIAKNNGYADELERTYKLISDISYSRSDVEMALQYLTKHLEIHDSLINQRNSERLNLLSAQFESELQQSQIELLTQNALVREEEIKRQKMLSYFYVGCFILVIIIAIILFYSNRKIKRINFELEVKTDQVKSQAAQLSNINRTKDKLLSIISHDIRSPLSSLRGVLNISQASGLSPKEFAELTAQIRDQLDTVYDDLGNLLQWTQSQLQGLNVNPEIFVLKEMVDEVAFLFEANAASKKIKLLNCVEDNIKVNADPNHVKLILRNLLSNAIKFSSEGGKVIVSDTINQVFVEVSVEDTGIGLSENELSKLFNPSAHFTKEGTDKEKGMGVGLLLTKEFVEKNGGTMQVVSEPGKGSKFSFTLRRAD